MCGAGGDNGYTVSDRGEGRERRGKGVSEEWKGGHGSIDYLLFTYLALNI
jgi:hypothetical protein